MISAETGATIAGVIVGMVLTVAAALIAIIAKEAGQ